MAVCTTLCCAPGSIKAEKTVARAIAAVLWHVNTMESITLKELQVGEVDALVLTRTECTPRYAI